MTQNSNLARTPCTYVRMLMDLCSRTWASVGTGCNASGSGEPCYKTHNTCRSINDYNPSSTYENNHYCSAASFPLPFRTGERPYVKDVVYSPVEIKNTITVSSRVTIRMVDDIDNDMAVDPNYSQRPGVPAKSGEASYWKRWVTRQGTSWKGRVVEIYEGYVGDAFADYQKRYSGRLESMRYSPSGIQFEIVDEVVDLSKVEVPAKSNVKARVKITDTDSTIYLTDVSPAIDQTNGIVRIGNELIRYASIDTDSKALLNCSRGWLYTTAEQHSVSSKAQFCLVLSGSNLITMLKTVLTAAGMASEVGFDELVADNIGDLPGGVSINVVMSEPRKVSEILYEIVELIPGMRVWVSEAGVITARCFFPNDPAVTYKTIDDTQNILHGSGAADINDLEFHTRHSLYWDHDPVGGTSDPDFGRLDVYVDADAEGTHEINDVIEQTTRTRFLQIGDGDEDAWNTWIVGFLGLKVWLARHIKPLVTVSLDAKDESILTGDMVRLSTDEIVDQFGKAVVDYPAFVSKRQRKDDKVALSLKVFVCDRVAYVAPDTSPDYDSASQDDKEYGFIGDANGKTGSSGLDPGYVVQ